MVELRQLGASSAGVFAIKGLPFSVGRQGADLVLGEPGIWDLHLVIEKGNDQRFVVVPQPPATVVLAGKALAGATPLNNGDVLELGSIRLQFRISATKQRSLVASETMAWLGLACLAALQVGLALSW